MRTKIIFTALALLALLAGCAPIPQPEQPAAAVGTFSEDAYFEHGVTVAGDLTVAGASNLTGATTYGADMVFEGATADAYETTFAITDPASSDKTITFPNSTGTVALNPYGASIEFEGATADAYELTLEATDPTADVTLTLPKETAAIVVSSLTTNATDAANSVTGASNKLVFEGATADGFETWFIPTDPSADRTLTLPNLSGTVHVNDTTQALVASTGALSGKLTLATWLNVTSQTPVVVTAGSTITPSGTLQPLTSTGVVAGSTSNAIADGTTAGDLLILRNANASDAITIDGTGGNVECKTDKALGAQDTLTLMWNGSDWVCLSLSDNS